MASINEAEIRFIPGTLIKNPTSATAPSYGGTLLGSGLGFRVDTGLRYYKNYAEEFGRTNRIFQSKVNPWCQFNLRQLTQDGINAFFPEVAADGIAITHALGAELATASYLYAADRATDPSVLIVNAVVLIESNGESLNYSLQKEWSQWVMLVSLPSSGTSLSMRPIASLFP